MSILPPLQPQICDPTFRSLAGARARKRSAFSTTAWMTVSISSSVVRRPSPKRIEALASVSSTPMARSTYEGSVDPDEHAEPEESATMSFRLMRSDSPCT